MTCFALEWNGYPPGLADQAQYAPGLTFWIVIVASIRFPKKSALVFIALLALPFFVECLRGHSCSLDEGPWSLTEVLFFVLNAMALVLNVALDRMRQQRVVAQKVSLPDASARKFREFSVERDTIAQKFLPALAVVVAFCYTCFFFSLPPEEVPPLNAAAEIVPGSLLHLTNTDSIPWRSCVVRLNNVFTLKVGPVAGHHGIYLPLQNFLANGNTPFDQHTKELVDTFVDCNTPQGERTYRNSLVPDLPPGVTIRASMTRMPIGSTLDSTSPPPGLK
jgi:hypothetical protein